MGESLWVHVNTPQQTENGQVVAPILDGLCISNSIGRATYTEYDLSISDLTLVLP